MKSKFLYLLSFLALIFCAFKSNDPITEFLKKLGNYSAKFPQEKVHLHIDKPYYIAGEDIWFKAYVLNTKTQTPTDLSKILYVELINADDSLIFRNKLFLNNGVGWGDFKLNNSLPEGNYRIRAYTNYMRNFGTQFFYDKVLKIGDASEGRVITNTTYQYTRKDMLNNVLASIRFEDEKGSIYSDKNISYEVLLNGKNILKGKTKTDLKGDAKINFNSVQDSIGAKGKIIATISLTNTLKVSRSIPIISTSNNIDVQFLPEGGELVLGLPQKIGIKAVNTTGLGESISGKIYDTEGKEIAALTTGELGMGSFMLNAQEGQTYISRIKFKDGSSKDFKLPIAHKNGHVFSINALDSTKVSIRLMTTSDLVNGQQVSILAQQHGNVYYITTTKIDKQVLTATIPKDKLPSGIIQISLLSAANEPLLERLIFVKNRLDLIDLKVNTEQVSLEKYGGSILNFNASSEGKPLIGSFSIAITNASKIHPDENNESNILSSLLMTSDLAGYVEKPNHYFLKNDISTEQDLDNLMLTQGWSRFSLKDVQAGIEPNILFQPERAFSISGTLSKSKKPVANGKITLFDSKKPLSVMDTLSNPEGRFNFDQLLFNDTTTFIVQGRTDKDKAGVDLNLDLKTAQYITPRKNSGDQEVNVNSSLMDYIKEHDQYFKEMGRLGIDSKAITLKDVFIKDRAKKNSASSNLNGSGKADFVITADKLQNYSDFGTMGSRFAGVSFSDNSARLLSAGASMNGGGSMLIIIDGVQSSGFNSITPKDIETVEVLKSASNVAIYGSFGANGVLVITTKKGGVDSDLKRESPGIVRIKQTGFNVPRIFYSPKYAVNDTGKNDYRSTIYWNPQVISDEKGFAQISYSNASEAGFYRVVIEGVDIEGKIARKVFTYGVK